MAAGLALWSYLQSLRFQRKIALQRQRSIRDEKNKKLEKEREEQKKLINLLYLESCEVLFSFCKADNDYIHQVFTTSNMDKFEHKLKYLSGSFYSNLPIDTVCRLDDSALLSKYLACHKFVRHFVISASTGSTFYYHRPKANTQLLKCRLDLLILCKDLRNKLYSNSIQKYPDYYSKQQSHIFECFLDSNNNLRIFGVALPVQDDFNLQS